jgi:Circadian oscillating protein COP23
MKNHFSSICTAILLPVTLLVLTGNHNPASAASYQPERLQIQPSRRLVSQNQPAEIEDKIQFTCGTSYNNRLNKKVPTTLAWSPSGKRALIQWVKQMDNNWTPEKRCQEVSRRMQEANTAGTMQFITNGKMNGQRVICSATEVNGDCKNLLMTMRRDDKPLTFMNEFREVFNGRSEGVVEHSSGEPQIYLRINLKQLWKNAPKVQ